MKETVAGAFISRFQLKADEVQALKGTRNGPISEVKTKVEMSSLPTLYVVCLLRLSVCGSRKYPVISSLEVLV